MLHGAASRWAMNGVVPLFTGWRMKATCRPSGDHVGSASRSTEGSRYVTVFAPRSYTPMNAWLLRALTNASFEPSGDQRSADAEPRVVGP